MNRLKWWQKTIVYQIYPKSFCDSNGDGIGDIPGIISKLNYLQSLGVGAIWLCPVYPSPDVDNGYDISDYCDIDPQYGTLADMEELIAQAGKRKMKIVMDLVLNHTSVEHEWFRQSRSSRTNPKRDWYIWRDPKADGSAPTNWRAIFGGSAWTKDEATGQYYLHTFSAAQPDLNWENPEVRQALYAVAKFWLDKGVGGFRMDAISYLKKPSVCNDLPADGPDGLAAIARADRNQPGILDFLREFKREVIAGHDIFTVAEADGVSPDEYPQWIGPEGVFDMAFDFSHMRLGFEEDYIWHHRKPWKLIDIRPCLTAAQEATAKQGWVPLYFENHDMPRCVSYFFPKEADKRLAAKFIATLLLTLRGTPFIYEGQELGMTNVKWPTLKMYKDISSYGEYELALREGLTPQEAMKEIWEYSRDNARIPMSWTAGSKAGFTTGRPWLPLSHEYGHINVATESREAKSVLNYYRQLVELRKHHAALIYGDYKEVVSYSPGIYGYARTLRDSQGEPLERIIVLANTTTTIRGYRIPELRGAQLLLSSYSDWEAKLLRDYEVRVYKVQLA